MGNEESPLKLGRLASAHLEPQPHVSEDFSSYSCFIPAAFSLFFLFIIIII